jgi:hypothetical protein
MFPIDMNSRSPSANAAKLQRTVLVHMGIEHKP